MLTEEFPKHKRISPPSPPNFNPGTQMSVGSMKPHSRPYKDTLKYTLYATSMLNNNKFNLPEFRF